MPKQNLKILIEVIKPKQNNETWNLFRLLLANSTNKFINATDIKAEKCMYVRVCVCVCPFTIVFYNNSFFLPVKMTLRWSIHCHVNVLGQMPKIVLKSIYPFKLNRSHRYQMQQIKQRTDILWSMMISFACGLISAVRNSQTMDIRCVCVCELWNIDVEIESSTKNWTHI